MSGVFKPVVGGGGSGGGDAVRLAQVTMTSEEFQAALLETPFDLLPAPGEGKFIQPIGPIFMTSRFASVPLEIFGEVSIALRIGDVPLTESLLPQGFGGAIDHTLILPVPLGQPEVSASVVNESLHTFSLGEESLEGRLSESTLFNGGENWEVGDLVYAPEVQNLRFQVETVDENGAILTYSVVDAGFGLFVEQQINGYPVNVSEASGVRAAVLNGGGFGYVEGSTVSIDGGTGANITVESVDEGGTVTSFTLNSVGSGYTPGTNIGTTPTDEGFGTGFTVDITCLGSLAIIQVDAIQPINTDYDGSFLFTFAYMEITT